MFTGLVQAVAQLQRCGGGVELLVPAGSGLDPAALALGDSVAVDGVCLTVTENLSPTSASFSPACNSNDTPCTTSRP